MGSHLGDNIHKAILELTRRLFVGNQVEVTAAGQAVHQRPTLQECALRSSTSYAS